MTSSTDTDQHPEVAEISALSEGLLPPDQATAVRDHLATCALCADVHSSLEEIRGLLGTLPGPAQMPADIAGRIEAALAAEALLDSRASAAVSRETESGADALHVSRETTAAAEPRRSSGRPGRHGRASTGPGRRRIRRRWRTAVFGAACALAATALGGVIVQSIDSPASDSGQHSTATDSTEQQLNASGFTADGLESQVQDLLSQADGKAAPSHEVGPQSTPNTTMKKAGPEVPSCVRAGIGRSDVPIAAEPGTYKGTEAYLVVLPHVTDAARVDAYVVDSSCTGKTPQTVGEVLLRATYGRD
ncbi:anti-sigma factor family protein [Streptomyces sp. KR80]|uniref:anti-sigma factor family protein n=1 Tax=Streptomyces sp. KR80 TaxID=3457426 RepID=UPI003FD1B87C